ncbi:phage holin [Rummeliibacillus stabekisii]|uniref:PTS mannose transporter subunit IID n=1 Tax=Rummeliibacillus stabekisii TaxID=241244 RepID=A0A143HCK2_9BACL|nr:phage holin [Rummeliibacillus stabekisii]AMW99195.1 PTS mannose transporter subunit IID [Rummeliibacillus stabekisii]
MTTDKLKQYIALFGGLLSAVLLFLQSLGIDLKWYTGESIDAFTNVLLAAVPFALVVYGIWKNTYVVSDIAKIQEKELEKKGLK